MTFTNFSDILTYTAPVFLSISIVIGLFYYKFIKSEMRFLLLYLLMCLFIDVASRIAGEYYNNNLIFIVIFGFLELLFFTLYYQIYFFKRIVWSYALSSSIGLVYIAWEIISLWNVSPSEFQTYSRVISAFFTITMAISYLFEKIENKEKQNNLIKLNSVFIIFFSLHLIFFLPLNFLINVPSKIKFYFWFINLLLTLTFYVYLGIEIWKNGLTQKRLHSGL
ncbi:hypothetical protein Q763_11480 [Flavobacterium beibuense F44-8]|uniref:YhhN-like protein n=1 Tax=Flavobacterium beibuense F44-8 TaxID=1406840 RepID=A0A0A2LK44_9FLAO|nr:hypothetical protein Q763_11480 [Flavobacterium beibuense F44-8]